MEYIFHIGFMLNIYILLVLSTNVTIISNLLTLCQAAFYGVGAYVGAFVLMKMNLPFLIVALLVMLFTGLISLLVSFASIKLKGDYFILATLGFQMIVYTILYNWVTVTNGPFGISGIPSVSLLGIYPVSGVYSYFVLSLLAVVVLALLFVSMKKSPYGRILRAMGTDELSLVALGRNVNQYKASSFFFSASFAGLAGVLYASYVSYIDPMSFTINESLFIISALFLGGTGNVKGPVLGSLFVVIFPELLRFLGLPESIAANLRQLIYGLSLIVLMYYRPQGLQGQVALK